MKTVTIIPATETRPAIELTSDHGAVEYREFVGERGGQIIEVTISRSLKRRDRGDDGAPA